ncbi:hypothetical protein NT6N_18730 [Oceaniferula spumae]|uniref:Aminotransferase class I/classII large domain-containing protein n=1 Tax=Oceaniferula spumae TaxID=2979115 RepID=A0AAT9FLK3_9BACT
MNFQEYKFAREKILAECSPLRLDCMNPFKAMSYLKDNRECSTVHCAQETTDLLLSSLHAEHYRSLAIPTRGVRSSLNGLFEIISQQGSDLWLPEDVYPFYWECANSHHLNPRSFCTLPSPDFSFLESTSPHSVVLLTNPISPLGRSLSEEEGKEIVNWLSQSDGRRIILDTVYSYALHIDPISQKLYETGQCFITHSLSKAWLERGIFGVLLTPETDYDTCLRLIEAPQQVECNSAHHALTSSADMPRLQQRAFSDEWNSLSSSIKNFHPSFNVPTLGYFSFINVNFTDVLNSYNALLIPASVFGSCNPNLSIATCLFNIPNRQ